MSSAIVTVLAMLGFVAVVVWVFIVKNREDFDEQASLPLDEDQSNDRNSTGHNGEESK
ncbi:CcoQ/FixQ family Cbb3-type cytochrome c oxidase assembly chaperone [Wenzhouxiangella sp. AB-CW3]|uniref:CcoQ/FixQ family Cbb3-type cytochrome c oxidase assembly chaperone n=1 Tax=Wenzhouxiangella sp. AB-CW3 TaxID=2771012 RepID=UPI00168A8CFA|nr:CcoQ/FixQ family Cbb3-type cytochrome c oxidase assembly chaperone [Wenzhouxiangella sp. AB-CW3]QOC22259.1 CcoQ/FixQ family Cbb3-type cytochrome c oxidase assembly chaperone [Wenzhouxiangella sp. AB-CW3]